MNPSTLVLLASLWLGTGIAGAGFYRTSLNFDGRFCNTTSRYDERLDQAISLSFSVLGPIYLVTAFTLSGFGYSGWSLAPYLCEQNKQS